MRTYLIPIAALALLGSAVGCDLLTGSDEQRVTGILAMGEHPEVPVLTVPGGSFAFPGDDSDWELPALEAPDPVRAGVPFDILVRTFKFFAYGTGAADVRIAGGTAELAPWDVYGGHPWDGVYFVRAPRLVRISFAQPGEGLIVVTGKRMYDPPDLPDEPRDPPDDWSPEVRFEIRVVVVP
jgi:hypothetical protein